MRFTKTIASASVAAVLGLAGVSVAGAASTTTSSSTPTAAAPGAKPAGTTATKHARRVKPAVRRRLARQGVTLAAKTINIPRADFVTELRTGKTIAEIATGHGVQPQTVIDALKAAAHTKIEAAKAAGKLTAARATRLERRFDRVIPKFVNTWHLKAKPAQG
jgi:transposase-like protein